MDKRSFNNIDEIKSYFQTEYNLKVINEHYYVYLPEYSDIRYTLTKEGYTLQICEFSRTGPYNEPTLIIRVYYGTEEIFKKTFYNWDGLYSIDISEINSVLVHNTKAAEN